MREVLTIQFGVLERLQQKSTSAGIGPELQQPIISTGVAMDSHNNEDETIFFELEDDDDDPDRSSCPVERRIPDSAAGMNIEVVLPEHRTISIPSRWASGNDTYHRVELNLRIHQAARILSALRDLIAEKSFQFSHVIRVAPRKGVRTRSRSVVAKINFRMSYHCRVYNQCRRVMVRLGADHMILDKFRVLQKEDLRSSSAVLDPNEPGSTRHRLSWIWQTGQYVDPQSSLDGENSERLRECK
jgi:hypothetical protein